MSVARRSLLAPAVALLLCSGLAIDAAAAPVPEVSWERLDDGPDLALHTMIRDSANDMLWIFGGVTADPCGNDFHNEVWRLDLGDEDARWQLARVDGLRPPPLIFHSATYDPLRQEMVVYGGLVQQRSCRSGDVNDPKNLWRLDLSDPDAIAWTRESIAGNLAPRYGHGAVYVPAFDALVVSGGLDPNADPRNDNWALLLGETPRRWVRLANAGFARRAGHALIVDEPNERLLAYGGFDGNRAQSLLDALDIAGEIDGADRWLRLRPENPSPSRSFFASAYDAERQLWWMQGGLLAANRFARDLQVLDLSGESLVWTNTQTVQNGPLDRFFHPGVWDDARARMLVHGGTPDNNRTLRDMRALVYQGLAPDPPTATPTGTATASPTMALETATAMSTATASASASPTTAVQRTPTASPTTDNGLATASPSPTAPLATASATPPVQGTATGTTPPPTVSPTSPPTATTPAGPARIHLPFALRNAAARDDAEPPTDPPPTPTALVATRTPSPTPTATIELKPYLEVESAFGGYVERLAVSGDRAYIGVGLSLRVVDISDPSAPVEVGRIDGLPATVRRIAADGARLAVGTLYGTMLYDLSDPDAPVLGSVIDALTFPSALALRGPLLVGSASGRLHLLDVADPAQPQPLSTMEGPVAQDLVVREDRIVAITQESLDVVDISDPTQPSALGSFTLPSRGYAVDVAGTLAAVAMNQEGLLLVDLSDEAAPAARGVLDTDGRLIDLDFDGQVLWLADSFSFAAVDVSDPDAPVALGAAVTRNRAFEVEVHGGAVLGADGQAGLRIFDAASTANPSELGVFEVAGRATVMAVRDGLAAVAHPRLALRLFDVGDPTAPRVLASLPQYPDVTGIDFDGDRLVLAESGKVVVLDVADPADPSELGSVDVVANLDDLVVVDGLAYVVDIFVGLRIVDVSDPAAPQLVGTLNTDGERAVDVAVDAERGLAFLASETAGLFVVDVGNPAAPSLRASLDTGRSSAVARRGERLYVGSGRGWHVVDVADADAPVIRGTAEVSGTPYVIEAAGDRAWIGHSGGVALFDVADPAAPQQTAELSPSARQFGIWAEGDRAVTSGDAGLLWLRLVVP